MNSDQCYNLLGLNQGASLPEIRNAYRKLVLEYHPDKNISSKNDMKFKLITEAYQTLRIKNMSVDRNSNPAYRDKSSVGPIHKKIKSWHFYLNMFYDVAACTQKMRYVKTVYRYLLKHKPILMTCCGLIQKHVTMPTCHLITSSYVRVNSFISHIRYRQLAQSVLKYLGIHS